MGYFFLQFCFGKFTFPHATHAQHIDECKQRIQFLVGSHGRWYPRMKRLDPASLDLAVTIWPNRNEVFNDQTGEAGPFQFGACPRGRDTSNDLSEASGESEGKTAAAQPI